MADAGAQLPPAAVVPGETIFLTWAPGKQSVDYARQIAREIRRRGGILTGCSLDREVAKGHECPVCGAEGLI